ncbi:thermonuclease family protein [Iodobacter sp.]|uniref:thermonuclease family protein n=1 Tax=Iodobacter sp. TaxID=1915058 RepID=UPI0025F62858|nr:thermonuclease family protein [Iodobacter sp.]
MLRFCVLLLLLTACKADQPTVLSGVVIKVLDGDSLIIRDAANQEHALRLAFIDAPEYSQAFGSESRRSLDRWAYQKTAVATVIDTDKYQRSVVLLQIVGKDINAEQVKAGLAWHYQHFAKGKQSTTQFALYQAAESEARAAQRGLWQEATPTPPWDYRRAHPR